MVAFNDIIVSSILAVAAMAAPTVLDQKSSSSSLVRRKNTNKCEAHIHIDGKSE
jgi:Ni/Co efflux regulator RcnB